MSMIADKMNTQSFQSYYYGLYVYNDYFTNEADVDASVLNTIVAAGAQTKIYDDSRYGMSNAKSMAYWVDCALSFRDGKTYGSKAWLLLQDYFLTQSVVITDIQMDTICGTGGIIIDEINKLEARLIADKKVPGPAPLSASVLSTTQWATSGLLGPYID